VDEKQPTLATSVHPHGQKIASVCHFCPSLWNVDGQKWQTDAFSVHRDGK